MRIAVDAMGGDNAPASVVEGAIAAANKFKVGILLVGQTEAIKPYISRSQSDVSGIEIVEAPEVVDMHESPSVALKQKKNSSINICMQLVKEGKAAAVVSAGNTGAVMAAALFTLGRLEGVSRPAIAAPIPTRKGFCILLDVGANVDCRPQHLVHFAVMGKVFAEKVFQREHARVGLLSIGEEKTKGNELTLQTYELLEKAPINFIGNVEGRDIVSGEVDVVVCDGFIGNVILKFAEGFAEMFMSTAKQFFLAGTDSAQVPVQEAFRSFAKKMDYSEYGGALLLGLNGTCVISHGGSSPKAIMNAIRVGAEFVTDEVNQHIIEELRKVQQHIENETK
ncbi:MAG: phosphate acyltransferase PlsX [bacterium]|nr:phosphate acyltransferase PlsX [bacterium]